MGIPPEFYPYMETQNTHVPTPEEAIDFIDAFNTVRGIAHSNSVSKGFWDKELMQIMQRNRGEALMLMVCELAEAFEGSRKDPNKKSDHIPEYTYEEEELADCIIRIFDWAGGRNLRVAEALIAKMHFNAGRPYMHGKTC